jgi:hypothetical protein
MNNFTRDAIQALAPHSLGRTDTLSASIEADRFPVRPPKLVELAPTGLVEWSLVTIVGATRCRGTRKPARFAENGIGTERLEQRTRAE